MDKLKFYSLSFLGPLAFKGDEYNGTLPPLELTSYSWTKVREIRDYTIFFYDSIFSIRTTF